MAPSVSSNTDYENAYVEISAFYSKTPVEEGTPVYGLYFLATKSSTLFWYFPDKSLRFFSSNLILAGAISVRTVLSC
jgi:hypothetical protein